jgi:hypothetical protein
LHLRFPLLVSKIAAASDFVPLFLIAGLTFGKAFHRSFGREAGLEAYLLLVGFSSLPGPFLFGCMKAI